MLCEHLVAHPASASLRVMSARRRPTQRWLEHPAAELMSSLPQATDIGSAHGLGMDAAPQEDPKFELAVLEAMLDHIAVHLERSLLQLESIAGPGLPALRLKVRRPQRLPVPVCEAASCY